MLNFPADFFEDEIREDFFVDKTMKTVWAAELEVLQEIAVICDRHNLPWFAAYGTLLGAVRHSGFIPWDDDIDIMMKREDYMKLLKYLPEELPNGYDVRCPLLEVEDEAEEYQCTVFNARTISIERRRLERYHGCPFIVGVDIFPLDYISRDARLVKYQREKFRLARQTAWVIKKEEDTDENREQVEEALIALNSHCKTTLKRGKGEIEDKFLVNRLWKLANEVAMQSDCRSGEYITQYMNYSRDEAIRFDKRIFDDIVYLPFEQVMLPAPKEYDKVLRTIYGDYTEIIKGGSSHDYPVYKKQLESLREVYNRWEEANEKDEKARKTLKNE